MYNIVNNVSLLSSACEIDNGITAATIPFPRLWISFKRKLLEERKRLLSTSNAVIGASASSNQLSNATNNTLVNQVVLTYKRRRLGRSFAGVERVTESNDHDPAAFLCFYSNFIIKFENFGGT